MDPPRIEIPLAPRLRGQNPNRGKSGDADLSEAAVSAEVCKVVAEEFVTVTPSLDMGGYGTWDLAVSTPERFASLMPICGGGDTIRAKNIKHVPQWVHHGERDDIIPISASKKMVTALERAGAMEVRFSVYAEDGHDSWTRAYGDIRVGEWMLGQRRRNDEKDGGDRTFVRAENKVQIV
ncbi:MAG: hypothetical protein Q9201_006529 [Fulgogasparrea decipioides]